MVKLPRRRRTPSPPPMARAEDVSTAATTAVTETAEWVRAADSKAGFAMTALTILLSAMANDLPQVRGLWSEPRASWSLLLLLASCLAVTAAITCSILVVVPRTRGLTPNRFSWPWLASASQDEVLGHVGRGPAEDDAWRQAQTLAVIAARKYKWLGWSLRSGALAAVTFAFWKLFLPSL